MESDDEDITYVYYGGKGEKGETPSKRGRGKGSKTGTTTHSRSPENALPRSESSEKSHQSGAYSGSQTTAQRTLCLETYEQSTKPVYKDEKTIDYEFSHVPSTSRSIESNKGRTITPDDGLKFEQISSDKSHKSYVEEKCFKPCEPLTSFASDYEPQPFPSKSKSEDSNICHKMTDDILKFKRGNIMKMVNLMYGETHKNLDLKAGLEPYTSPSSAYKNEENMDYEFPPLQSISRPKDNDNGHKIAPDDSLKFEQRSDESHKSCMEEKCLKPCEPSTSFVPDYESPPLPSKSKYKDSNIGLKMTDDILKFKNDNIMKMVNLMRDESHKNLTVTAGIEPYTPPTSLAYKDDENVDYEFPSLPSTPIIEDNNNEHKIAPDDSLKFEQRSDESHKSCMEEKCLKPCELSTSFVPDYESPPLPSKFKDSNIELKMTDDILKLKNDNIMKIMNLMCGEDEKNHDYKFAALPSTSISKVSDKGLITAPDDNLKLKQKSSNKSRKNSTDEICLEPKPLKTLMCEGKKDLDYEFPTLPSTSRSTDRENRHKANDNLKFKQKFSSESLKIDTKMSYGNNPPLSSTPSAKECQSPQKVMPENLGSKYKQRSTEASHFPKRPGLGKKGRPIKLVANLYPIKVPNGYVFNYDIEITETNQRTKTGLMHKKYRCLNSKNNREIIEIMLESNPVFKGFNGAFDGQTKLFTAEKLKIDLPFSCTVTLPKEKSVSKDSKCDTFKVDIKSLVSKINLDSIYDFYKKRCSDLPQEAIMALEIVLRHDPCLHFTPIGRSFYYPDVGNLTPFGGGLEIWFGYHQAVRLCQWQPAVNIDISATTFWQEGPLLNYIADHVSMTVKDLRTLRQLNENDIKRMNRKLKQRQIRVTHLSYGRKYRIVKLRTLSANQEYIEITDKKNNKIRMTVEQYFLEMYGMRLKYGNLPCVQVQPEKRNVFLPVEVCEFTGGQHYRGELNSAQKDKMINSTNQIPHERFSKIQDIVDKADFNRNKTMRGFGIEISNQPLFLDARILDSPKLLYKDQYKSEKSIIPRDGQWNVVNTQFFQGAKISKWVLLSFEKYSNLNSFVDVLIEIGRKLGLQIGKPSDSKVIHDMHCDKVKLLRDIKEKKNELALIVIPRLDERVEKRIYEEIKIAAEIGIGLATQCFKAERLGEKSKRRWSQIASNLCLKINAKLGGENHSLMKRDIPEILHHPVIIIGADVNHPAPTQNQPSVACCVGSLDCFGKRFAVTVHAQVNSNSQKNKLELICDIEDMVHNLLLAFYRHTRKKPEKIIFYRDGVSEGELAGVKNEEIRSIRRACQKLSKDYKPGITGIVVQKRHHVRFRPRDRRDGAGSKGNIPPGTVIDSEVTHPKNFDFFLCSQFGAQGTSRPSHYLVIEDDNNMTADDLQKLTFYLCHMYVRCTRSISIPAPVAYADLAAYRARRHLDSKMNKDKPSKGNIGNYKLTAADIDAIKVVEPLKNSMYFV